VVRDRTSPLPPPSQPGIGGGSEGSEGREDNEGNEGHEGSGKGEGTTDGIKVSYSVIYGVVQFEKFEKLG
jgi:hypothetical protein